MALLLRLLRSWLALLVALACTAQAASDHTNNWAVLVCSSRFWCGAHQPARALSRVALFLAAADPPLVLLLGRTRAGLPQVQLSGASHAGCLPLAGGACRGGPTG